MANARAAKKAARAKEAQTKAAEVKAAEAATEVKAEEPQTVEVKTEAPAAEPVAEVKEADKTEVKAEAEEVKPVKKVGRPKKTAVQEAPKAAKKAKEAKNEAAKAEAAGVNVVVEFNGTQRKVDEIVDKIKNEWVAAGRLSCLGHAQDSLSCQNPEGVFKYFIDPILDGGEVQTLWQYGVEGTHYVVGDDGKFVFQLTESAARDGKSNKTAKNLLHKIRTTPW